MSVKRAPLSVATVSANPCASTSAQRSYRVNAPDTSDVTFSKDFESRFSPECSGAVPDTRVTARRTRERTLL
jgi:hypothetical protein